MEVFGVRGGGGGKGVGWGEGECRVKGRRREGVLKRNGERGWGGEGTRSQAIRRSGRPKHGGRGRGRGDGWCVCVVFGVGKVFLEG